MKKRTIKAKRLRRKRGNITPLNVSTMQGNDKPTNDISNEIHIARMSYGLLTNPDT